jgi:hypothetical protein
LRAADFKSAASACSATPARRIVPAGVSCVRPFDTALKSQTGDFILNARLLTHESCPMGTKSGPAARTDVQQIDETRRQIKELSDAWTSRHRLRPGTREYATALEAEERLITRIWKRLRAGSPGP